MLGGGAVRGRATLRRGRLGLLRLALQRLQRRGPLAAAIDAPPTAVIRSASLACFSARYHLLGALPLPFVCVKSFSSVVSGWRVMRDGVCRVVLARRLWLPGSYIASIFSAGGAACLPLWRLYRVLPV